MKIQNVNNTTFNGYDARRLKGFLIGSNPSIVSDLQKVARKEGFKVYSKLVSGNKTFCGEAFLPLIHRDYREMWAQDVWFFLKNQVLSSQNKSILEPIINFFNCDYKQTKNHISGGNIFIVDNDGKNEVLVGESELKKHTVNQIKKDYEVDTVHILPQMDYHLDLFIRPLNNKRVLVTDDNLTISVLLNGYEKLKAYLKKIEVDKEIQDILTSRMLTIITDFKTSVEDNNLANSDKVISKLKFIGYEPISVPARIYQTYNYPYRDSFLSHDCNYINACVLLNTDNELVYITNKSDVDDSLGLHLDFMNDFDFNFQDEFKKCLLPYVKEEHIYFLDGENNFISKKMLRELQGGIHCATAEVPL